MKKNLNKIYEIFIFTGLIACIVYLLTSGKVDLYLHPKMIKYLVFSLVMLILIDLYWLWELMKESGSSRAFRYSSLLLALPILFMVIFPSRISGSVLHNKVVKMNDSNTVTVSMDSSDTLTEETADTEEADLKALEEAALSPIDDSVVSLGDMDASDLEAAVSGEAEGAMTATEEATGTVTGDEALEDAVSNPNVLVMDDFWDFLLAVYEDQERMMGQTMQVDGFIFREDGYESDTAIMSRLVMACCAADAYITGVFLKDDAVAGLEDDEWYRITGVLREEAVYNPVSESYQVVPVLAEISVEAIEAYENPYVYPR